MEKLIIAIMILLLLAPLVEMPAFVVMGFQGWQFPLFLFSLTSSAPIAVYLWAMIVTAFATVLASHLLSFAVSAVLTQNMMIKWLKHQNAGYTMHYLMMQGISRL